MLCKGGEHRLQFVVQVNRVPVHLVHRVARWSRGTRVSR
jgi:hypothetical protein